MSGRTTLLMILLGAFALRATAAVVLQHRLDTHWQRRFLIEGDATGYWELGRRIAGGDEYAWGQPPRRVLRMPGFPAALAVSMQVADRLGLSGQQFLIARLMMAGAGTAATGLVYWLGKTLFDRATGLIAAGLTAVLPFLVGFSAVLLSETLFAAGLAGSLAAMARLVRADSSHAENRSSGGGDRGICRVRLTWAVFTGLWVAAACYVRPSWLLAGPLFAAALLFRSNWKTNVLPALVVVVMVFAALLPWAYRNAQVTGHWVFTTLWAGPSLYDGLNPQATGASQMQFFDDDALMQRGLSEFEMDREYRRRAWRFVRDHPGRTVELAAAKAARYWKPWPNAEQFSAWPYRVAGLLSSVPLFVLAAVGGWHHRRDVWAWGLTAGPVLYFAAVHCLFVGSLRYRLPAEYPLCVLAAAGGRVVWHAVGNAGQPELRLRRSTESTPEIPSDD